MKFLISAGGTGGHLYPAQALALELLKKNPKNQVMFAAGGLRINRYFDRDLFDYRDIQVSKVSWRKPLKTLLGTYKLLKGYLQSKKLLQSYKPDVVIGFGSFTTFPVMLAAKTLKVPIILHEINTIPGLVNRLFSPFALFTGIFFPETKKLLKGRSIRVDTPLRYKNTDQLKMQAQNYFDLSRDMPTLLVFGGSQGALAINEIFCAAAQKLHQFSLQILHFTGDSEMTKNCQEAYCQAGIKSHVKDFESRMDLAWSLATISMTRSGASTISEQLHSEVPAIFVPYPYATDLHQHRNANFVAKQVGGAIVIDQKELTVDGLVETLRCLLQKKETIDSMRSSIQKFKQDKSCNFADLIIQKIGNDNER
ncbi:MAG: undecaprenyldiphospho-muramoylpentapeptide beta-N-acetylglucosaminyltransferase [Parachlamydiales bacterium]|nr:undecaprenyldiphospho-muramoylpentapeptide beta-N-acetylglucosaminyltransferase [Parachlamydiales bacterium]